MRTPHAATMVPQMPTLSSIPVAGALFSENALVIVTRAGSLLVPFRSERVTTNASPSVADTVTASAVSVSARTPYDGTFVCVRTQSTVAGTSSSRRVCPFASLIGLARRHRAKGFRASALRGRNRTGFSLAWAAPDGIRLCVGKPPTQLAIPAEKPTQVQKPSVPGRKNHATRDSVWVRREACGTAEEGRKATLRRGDAGRRKDRRNLQEADPRSCRR